MTPLRDLPELWRERARNARLMRTDTYDALSEAYERCAAECAAALTAQADEWNAANIGWQNGQHVIRQCAADITPEIKP